jgi:L-alanine-DL-glutamate epimerase-like enolase superfamily enzyme
VEKIKIAAYEIPCDFPESDGTLAWKNTTLILVSLQLENKIGLGFSYGHEASLDVIKKTFVPILKKTSLFEFPSTYYDMLNAVRNIGCRGIAAHAISAVDIALWDLKAKILEMPLCHLFGMAREKIPVYGSGGFTSYSIEETALQFKKWKDKGINKFKMKVGRNPSEDVNRVKMARNAIADNDELFVDANGAYTRKEALDFAQKFREYRVTWFEEPVSSDDLEGLNLLRNQTKMNITAGEYGYDIFYFKNMLHAQSIDILQADATRCCGYTGFLQACTLSKAFNIPISSHTAPSIHLHACLSQSNVCHMEFFHDHVRIEETYFDGFPKLENGCLIPHLDRLGHGLELKDQDIQKYLIREEIL